MTALELLQWGLLLLTGAVTAVNALVMYRMWSYIELIGWNRSKAIEYPRRVMKMWHSSTTVPDKSPFSGH